ncbi:MAG: glycerophosphodiester phosphodiesterase [Actinobacteria bacterium]|nr:glycerophosphodiester phosphodiesterase [Actinomycetota bacterium]
MCSAPSPGGLPSLSPIPYREAAEVLRIAHRGAGGGERYGRDDLLQVRAQGAHLIEFDLHVTADDHLVARHDPVLDVGGVPVWLADSQLAEVSPSLQRCGVLTADDIVRGAKRAGLGLYADIKSFTRRAAGRLLSLLESEGMTDRTILASARSDVVALCAETIPAIPRAALFASTLEEPVQLAHAVQAQYVHPCWERLPRPDKFLAGPWLKRVRAYGLGVICWHEERPDVVQGLYELGVDGICTDQPELLTRISTSGRAASR